MGSGGQPEACGLKTGRGRRGVLGHGTLDCFNFTTWFEGAYPSWDLVYAPMLLGLLVLIVATLLSAVIAVLARKRTQMAQGVKELAWCTAVLERAERSKSETVANVSHELRTPIIGMMGMIEELLESALEEWQQADLKDARACAVETVDLINRVLDLAKLQAGRLHLETLPCCLRRIVHEATTFARPEIHTMSLQVTSHVDESVPEVLLGDPTRLSQVIAELVAHAMSNTASGHVAVHLWCIPPSHHAAIASGAPHDAAIDASQAPPACSAWQQLPACVRRFPPLTRLACLHQHVPARQGGPAAEGDGSCRKPGGHQETCVAVEGTGKAKEVPRASQPGEPRYGIEGASGAVERQGGGGRLEEEVREWVEGACRGREEGEWMVVVACEDTGGGIPPEEMRWVLDPHGLSCPSPRSSKGQQRITERIRSFGRSESWQSLERTARASWDPLHRDRKAAARPRWTPYPVRFLLSTSLVAEMGGGMAVLSDATTGTTILLALSMRGGEGTGSGEGEEGNGEEVGETGGAVEGLVKRESGSQRGMEVLSSGGALSDAAFPAPPPQHAAGARSLVHAHTFPRAEMAGSVGEAEALVRALVVGQRVVVVDDNAVNRMVARRTLQGYGAHVLLLCSGEDALHALSTPSPSSPTHLLLLDLHMPPGIDGFETARRIRALERAQQVPEANMAGSSATDGAAEACAIDATVETGPLNQRLCVIALTADLDAGVKRACMEAGMDGAVRKPIVAHELLSALTAAGFTNSPRAI
ncbi:hypothetical protein CLOM_g17793 [Closterium sp. NIES-68]|nr:hypothetical protein CLOM_g17793 [Closterium sp. NIES-68]GJP62278.1 hypothetical protein CLOP_g19362 [Closterium sp. NIES-67]